MSNTIEGEIVIQGASSGPGLAPLQVGLPGWMLAQERCKERTVNV